MKLQILRTASAFFAHFRNGWFSELRKLQQFIQSTGLVPPIAATSTLQIAEMPQALCRRRLWSNRGKEKGLRGSLTPGHRLADGCYEPAFAALFLLLFSALRGSSVETIALGSSSQLGCFHLRYGRRRFMAAIRKVAPTWMERRVSNLYQGLRRPV